MAVESWAPPASWAPATLFHNRRRLSREGSVGADVFTHQSGSHSFATLEADGDVRVGKVWEVLGRRSPEAPYLSERSFFF